MNAWWAGIPLLERVLFFIGTPSALILLIQTLLLLFGGGDDDAVESDASGLPDAEEVDAELDTDADTNADTNADTDAPEADYGLRLFTVRGVMAFLAVGSWAGIAALEGGILPVLALVIALASGLLSLVLIAKLIQVLSGLQESGTISLRTALGESGTVYIPIPARRSGRGKIQLVLGDQLREMEAITEGDALATGTLVRVVDLSGDVMVVERE